MKLTAVAISILILLCSVSLPGSSESSDRYSRALDRFEYARKTPIDLRVISVTVRDGVSVYDVTYLSTDGGRVPAYLVVPRTKGPFAAVVFAHWAMAGAVTRNRTEFLNEAIALAHAGAVSLLPDAPFARPGQQEDSNPLSETSILMFYHQVLDLRRGIDLLTARSDVDKSRIAFVGHSYNANAGGVLTGVEKRIKTFVLMAGGLSDIESMDTPSFRKLVGDTAVEHYIREYWWLDPYMYISRAAPASVLLQYGRHDPSLSETSAAHYFTILSQPKKLKFYDAGHALNAAARHDRISWLTARLQLRPVSTAEIDAIPETK